MEKGILILGLMQDINKPLDQLHFFEKKWSKSFFKPLDHLIFFKKNCNYSALAVYESRSDFLSQALTYIDVLISQGLT